MLNKAFLLVILSTHLTTVCFADDFADQTCLRTRFEPLLQKIDDRADRVERRRELNLAILGDRKKADRGETAVAWADTVVPAVLASFVGAYVGALAGLSESGAVATALGTSSVNTTAVFTFSTTLGGMVLAGGGTVYALTQAGDPLVPGTTPSGDASTIDNAKKGLPTAALINQALTAGFGRFDEAHHELGRQSIIHEQTIDEHAAWYHVGWDQKHTIDNMVALGEANDRLYAAELDFLQKARQAVLNRCESAKNAK